MRSLIREYLELSEEAKNQLCKKAVVVFDTNVLLNLYRFSNDTRTALLDTMHELSDRIWIPAQVITEFMRNRYDVIYEASNRYDKLTNDGDTLVKNCIDQLRMQEGSTEVIALRSYIHDWLERHKSANLIVAGYSNDVILNDLLTLLDKKVGNSLSEQEFNEIIKEGEERYKKKIPPGYKDATKTATCDNNEYGDLIVWKEILKYAKQNKKDIVFVTHDQKEDWWNRVHGKTVGPRFELRKEFYDQTQQDFHMYNMYGFLQQFSKVKKPLDPKIALEIRDIEQNLKLYLNIDKNRMSDEERIAYNIEHLINTIQKQKKTIRTLDKKYGNNKPDHILIQYHNTIENLHRKEAEYDRLKSKLIELQASLNFMEN